MEVLVLLVSLISIVIAILGWRKSRIIYDVELCEFLSGERGNVGNVAVRNKLQSGNYTILYTQQGQGPYGPLPDFNILLGKIKK